MAILVTSAVQVARFANALYGVKLGSVTNAAVMEDISVVGLTSAVNSYYASSFGSMTNAAVATSILGNLGLTGNTAAQAYVEAQLNAAGAAKGAAVLTMLNAFSNMTSDGTFGSAATAWNAKIVAAQAYTASYTADITSDTNVAVSGSTFTLTTATNNFTGTASDDTFDASLSANSLQTLSSLDNLNGGEGADTLSAVLNAASTIRPTVTSIETFELTSNNDSAIWDMSSVSGTTAVINVGSTNNFGVKNIASTDLSIKVQSSVASKTQTFTYLDSALSGTNTATVTLDGALGTVALANTSGGSTVRLETVAIVGAGADSAVTLDLSGSKTTSVTVSGNTSLDLDNAALASTVTTVDGSAATGAFTIQTNSSAVNPTVTGGSGNDTIRINGANTASVVGGAGNDTIKFEATFEATDAVAGGDGVDTLSILDDADSSNDTYTIADATLAKVTGIEVIAAEDATTADMSSLVVTLGANAQASGVTTLTQSTGGALTATMGVAYTNDLTVNLKTGALNVSASGQANVLNVKGIVADFDGTITGGTSTSDKLTMTVDNSSATLTNVTAVENILFVADGVKTATLVLVDGNIAATKSLTIDASALTNNLSSVTITDSAEADATTSIVFTGGAGNDVITLGAGNDNVSMGAGNDTVKFGAATAVTSSDTIEGGTGTNKIVVADLANGGTDVSYTIYDSALVNKTNISSIEIDDFDSNDQAHLTVTLGANAQAMGLTKITTDLYGDLNGTVTTDFTGTITLDNSTNLASVSADNTVNFAVATGGSATIVAKFAQDIANVMTVTGGSGDSDTISLVAVASTSLTATELASLTKFEKLTVSSDVAAVDVTLSNNNAASGVTFTVDASALTSGTNAINLIGTAEADAKLYVIGGAGADTLTGGSGADSLYGGSGIDTVNGGSGADYIEGGAGNDTSLNGDDGVDTVDGGAGNDTITGGSGYDSLIGGDGNDTFVMSAKADFGATSSLGVVTTDTVSGGAGTDTISLGAASFTLSAAELANISGIEKIAIGAEANVITIDDTAIAANGQNITIDLSGGTTYAQSIVGTSLTSANSLVVVSTTAHTATETLRGGAGNDIFRFMGGDLVATDSIVGAAGTDTIQIEFDGDNARANTVNLISGIENITFVTKTVFTDDATADAYSLEFGTSTLIATSTTVDASAIRIASDGSAANTDYLSLNAGNLASTRAVNATGAGGADILVGGSGADTLSGGAGNDVITGGAGADNLSGGDGVDTFSVGTAAHFQGLNSVETVTGGAGNDTLTFSAAVALSGTDLSAISSIETIDLQTTASSISVTDTVATTNGVANLAITENGNLAITVNASGLTSANAVTVTFDATTADSLVGGSGNDTFKQLLDDDAVIGTNTITGGSGTDTIYLNLVGGTTTNHVFGAGITGIEKVNFWAPASTDADTSADVVGITVDAANLATGETMTITASSYDLVDTSTGITVSTTYAGKIVVNASAETTGSFVITGGTAGDSLLGGSGADTLTGGSGSDTLSGGTGADSLNGGAGTDSLVGGVGNDVIDGGASADTITGGDGIDTITLGSGNDVVIYSAVSDSNSSTGVDTITDFATAEDKLEITLSYSTLNTDQTVSAARVDTAGTGVDGVSAANDKLTGARGEWAYDTNGYLLVNFNADAMITASDYKIGMTAAATPGSTIAEGDINFAITTGSGADNINAGGGDDTITSGVGNDTITSGAGNDSVLAGAGVDSIDAGGGNDFVDTDAGDDIILTSTGADTLVGGAGADSFYFGASSGLDVIYLSTQTTAAAGDGSADLVIYNFSTPASLTATDNYKTIWNFDTSDVIQFKAGLLVGSDATGGDMAATVTTAQEVVTARDYVASATDTASIAIFELKTNATTTTGELTSTSALNATTVAAFIGGTVNATMKAVFLVDDGTDSYMWYYNYVNNGTATSAASVQAAELTLIGIIKNSANNGASDFAVIS
jgi:trimeric autotransporter adhesin